MEPNMSRRDAMGRPGKRKCFTWMIGPSGGRGAGKIIWKPMTSILEGGLMLETYRPPAGPPGLDGPGVPEGDRMPSARGSPEK